VEERYHEDRAGDKVPDAASIQYLWDIRCMDASVLSWRYVGEATETVYYTNDATMNVTAVVDAASGEAVERYVYTPYGQATFLDGEWEESGKIVCPQ
jgi:hypothetical protein